MVARLARWYARPISNINVNIVLAGLLTMGLTVLTLHLSRYAGINTRLEILALKIGADLVFDVVIYYALHWIANHGLRGWARDAARHADRPAGSATLRFFRQATLVQFERAILAPIYYGVAGTIVYLMLDDLASNREIAAVCGFAGGLLVTRVIHTGWLIWTDRNRTRVVRPDGTSPRPVAAPIAAGDSDAAPRGLDQPGAEAGGESAPGRTAATGRGA